VAGGLTPNASHPMLPVPQGIPLASFLLTSHYDESKFRVRFFPLGNERRPFTLFEN